MTIDDEIERLKQEEMRLAQSAREVRSRVVELQALTAEVKPYCESVDGWYPAFVILDGNSRELALTDDEQFATIAAEAWNAAHKGRKE